MSIPSTFDAVKSHLAQVQQDPSTALDVALIEKLQLQLIESTDPLVPATLLSQISALLPILQEDPTPLTTLGIKATTNFSFTDLQSVDPPVNLIAGFKAPSPPINLLALSLLAKAGKSSSEAAIVAGDSELVASLVELWLSTSSTEVAQAALETLWALLEIDVASHLETGEPEPTGDHAQTGQGLMWRRVFKDKDVYGLLFGLCSLRNEAPGDLSKRERTIAQGRLLALLGKAGRLRWDMISTAQIPEVEAKYQSDSILHFATCQMVQESDVLMHMTLLSFFRELLDIEAPGLHARSYVHSASTFSSPALDFLVAQKLHSKVLSYYLDDSKLDPVDLIYLSGPVMAYVSRYAELYPNHLLQSPATVLDGIVSTINRSLAIPAIQWAHGESPTGHLAVLASLPRVLLVEAGKHGANPVLAIPTDPANDEALDVLAKIFHGPQRNQIPGSMDLNTSGQTPTDWDHEAAAARILYFLYLNEHPTFWTSVVATADVLVMKDTALSAITFMRAIVTANWKLSPPSSSHSHASRFQLPSEENLSQLSPATSGFFPSSGAWAVLTPPALTTLLPYLFKPPRSYADFVGGGAGDSQNVVWKVATAKHDVLVVLLNRLRENGGQIEGFDDIMRTLQQRVNEGPWGPVQSGGTQVLTADL
ncbi:hypothetical protein N7499_001831 [Penicillium canescens]|uniref:DNA mismatch repair protein HSM3 N-terminal domain-containing protein n=1 Tax=Penicillium canescens TaxID=5083 RepID=A0AAD6N6I7_PENCN|nr:uncharacterized protein N7446_009365 [Penicillium canescens]KAJ6002305.1 hypothetical protein N7522_007532 [Penicillium canescens]KAJ6034612.1 hypothetical protein N7460_008787 [Penicillium canescens]KAJ6046273.1 hypothetical protein N7444_007527 [Penicillium canescens]KAJ6053353.1 hypothetical protein N7446_009365 [Penicillium canescens]KAJ6097457.1 hypothetical protein N7499_001831 [Penicillium canescens]